MLVKICGITRLEDALAAVEQGAGALGFVCWPGSPRFIEPQRAQEIIASLPPFVTAVGVFVNQPAAEVNGIAALARLGAVQLHGDESPEYAVALREPVIKAIAVGDAAERNVAQWPDRVTVLLDVPDPARRGGTGQTVDWNRAADIAQRRRTILAGGLTPANVAAAINRVRPFGIDVSSGVETRPGVKDHARLAALFREIGRS